MKIPKIMTRNSENGFNISRVKVKKILFSKKHDIKVAYLKIMNQGTDGHDFPEKIKKGAQRNQYKLMNYPLLNLCVPSKDKREVSLYIQNFYLKSYCNISWKY